MPLEFKGNSLQMKVHKRQGKRQPDAQWKRQRSQRPGSNDPIGQVLMIRNKIYWFHLFDLVSPITVVEHLCLATMIQDLNKVIKVQKRKLYQLRSQTFTSQKWVSQKEGKVL